MQACAVGSRVVDPAVRIVGALFDLGRSPMSHAPIFLSLGLLFGIAGLGGWPAAVPSVVSHGQPQEMHAEASSPSRDAIAATIIEAMRSRFDGADIEFRFDTFHGEQGSLRDIALSGAGQVRLAGGDAWLPIRYSALFDRFTGEVLAPQVEFDTDGAHAIATGVDRTSLDTAVDGRLSEEFASQTPEFALGDLKLVVRDARYVLVAGTGRADFAGEGTADVSVQALYDRRTHAWLDVRYTLG